MEINKRNVITFIILVLISSIIFGNFLNMHYATDTYNIIDRGYTEYAIKYSLNDGRIFMCVISLIADFLNLSIKTYIVLLTFLAILTSCISIVLIKNIVEKYRKPNNIYEEIILIIICFTIIFNFMFLENMQFAECFVMSISILLYIIAANILVSDEKNHILKSGILTTLGILFYQGTIGFYVVMAILFSFMAKKTAQIVFKNVFISGLICIIAAGINLYQIELCGKLLGMKQTRMGDVNIKNICNRIILILVSLCNILKYTISVFPKNCLIYFFVITTILANIFSKKEKRVWNLYVIILTILSIACSFAINIFTTSGFGTARMMYPLGALIGNIFLLIYTNTNIIQNKKIILITVLIMYLIILIWNFINIINMHKKVEALTREECKIILDYITEYEQETGIELKKIAVYSDKNKSFFYKNIKNYSALCVRPLAVEWGDNGSINYWCNKKLIEITPDEEIFELYFEGKDWNELDKAQFIFIEDVLHYCSY